MHDEVDQPTLKVIGTRTIRLDASPVQDVQVEAPTKGGLLELFRAWMKRGSQDRRRARRHDTSGYQVWLGWWKGEQAFFAHPATLVNVSRGGALITVSNPPPEGFAAWICVGEPDPKECVEGTVLEVRRARRRECFVRLAFRDACPTSLFQAAVCMAALPKVRPGQGTSANGEDR